VKVFRPHVFAKKTKQFIERRQESNENRGNNTVRMAREKLKSARQGGALQLLEPPDTTNTSY
jgi:hypothetical protein